MREESLLKKLPRLEPASRNKTEKTPATSGQGIEEIPSLLLEWIFGSNWFGSLLDMSEFKPVPLRGITTAHATALQYSPAHSHGIYQCPSMSQYQPLPGSWQGPHLTAKDSSPSTIITLLPIFCVVTVAKVSSTILTVPLEDQRIIEYQLEGTHKAHHIQHPSPDRTT